MNVGINPAMLLFSSEINGSTNGSIGGIQTSNNAMNGVSKEGSLFQSLLTQLMSQKNPTLESIPLVKELQTIDEDMNQELVENEVDLMDNADRITPFDLSSTIPTMGYIAVTVQEALSQRFQNANGKLSQPTDESLISNVVSSMSTNEKYIKGDPDVYSLQNTFPAQGKIETAKEFIIDDGAVKSNITKSMLESPEQAKLLIPVEKLNKDVNGFNNAMEQLTSHHSELAHGVSTRNEILYHPVQDIIKMDPYSQIGKEILSKLEQKGPMEFKMQLEPENLGKIDIKMQLNEGKLIIDIIAFSSKTQALLTSQVDKLVQSLGLQNVLVETIQVNHNSNLHNQDGQNQAFAMNGGMNFSQRRNQEQMQEHFIRQKNSANILSNPIEEQNGIDAVSGTGRKDASQRMDYVI